MLRNLISSTYPQNNYFLGKVPWCLFAGIDAIKDLAPVGLPALENGFKDFGFFPTNDFALAGLFIKVFKRACLELEAALVNGTIHRQDLSRW